MRDIDGVYRRLNTTKNHSKYIKRRLFCGAGFYKRREKNHKEKKKDDHTPAIGKNYINKMFLFF